MGRKTKSGRSKHDLQIDLLNRLTIRPSLKAAAREIGVNPSTVFTWIRESAETGETISWLGYIATFAAQVQLARRLQIVVLEHEARSLATLGHVQARWHDGRPCYRHDPKVEADALAMSDFEWDLEYGDRKREDVYARDENGALIPEEITSPPNAQLLAKMLSSLVPAVYKDSSEISITHQGHVWIEGQGDAPKALPQPSAEFNDGFGLTTRPDQRQRPANTLACPRPCVSSEEFDGLYHGKRLLREVVLFRNSKGRLLDLLPDDVLVIGTPQHRAYQDERPDYNPPAVHPTELLDEGYENPWLKALCPDYKPEFKPPTAQENLEVAIKAAAKMAAFEPAKKPYMSPEARAEGIGRGTPAPGGRSILK
ncbi:MAG: hypothetical protein WCF22_13130 [Candidatus Sulfotelmatobacter sp.]